MRYPRTPFYLLLALALTVSVTACDQSSQNFDFGPGDGLTIQGAATVATPDTAEYNIRAFTINKDYTWSVSSGAEIINTRRDGEYIDVAFTSVPSDSSYTISVNDGEYDGSLVVTVE